MTRVLATLLLLITLPALAQKTTYDTSRDGKNGSLVLKGNITFDDLLRETSFNWMQQGVAAYKPRKKEIKILKAQLPKFKVLVFMGTWCGDSQDLIPQLYKVLKEADYP